MSIGFSIAIILVVIIGIVLIVYLISEYQDRADAFVFGNKTKIRIRSIGTNGYLYPFPRANIGSDCSFIEWPTNIIRCDGTNTDNITWVLIQYNDTTGQGRYLIVNEALSSADTYEALFVTTYGDLGQQESVLSVGTVTAADLNPQPNTLWTLEQRNSNINSYDLPSAPSQNAVGANNTYGLVTTGTFVPERGPNFYVPMNAIIKQSRSDANCPIICFAANTLSSDGTQLIAASFDIEEII